MTTLSTLRTQLAETQIDVLAPEAAFNVKGGWSSGSSSSGSKKNKSAKKKSKSGGYSSGGYSSGCGCTCGH